MGGPQTDIVDVETTVVPATRVYEYHLTGLSGPKLLNDVVEQRNGGNMYINLPCQSCDRASITSARGSGTGDMNYGRCVF